jgi:hypothetical protein
MNFTLRDLNSESRKHVILSALVLLASASTAHAATVFTPDGGKYNINCKEARQLLEQVKEAAK